MTYLAKTLVFLLVVLASSSAWAMTTCKRSDVKGDWRLHFTLTNSTGFSAGGCAIRVTSKGKILRGGECANARFRIPVTGGKFRVDRNCRVSGVI